MRGLTKEEYEELKILGDLDNEYDFDHGDPCEEVLVALVAQGRAIFEPPNWEHDGHWVISEQGLLALKIWASIDHEKFFTESS